MLIVTPLMLTTPSDMFQFYRSDQLIVWLQRYHLLLNDVPFTSPPLPVVPASCTPMDLELLIYPMSSYGSVRTFLVIHHFSSCLSADFSPWNPSSGHYRPTDAAPSSALLIYTENLDYYYPCYISLAFGLLSRTRPLLLTIAALNATTTTDVPLLPLMACWSSSSTKFNCCFK